MPTKKKKKEPTECTGCGFPVPGVEKWAKLCGIAYVKDSKGRLHDPDCLLLAFADELK